MKILHIGDVHLGCKLDGVSRNSELSKVFDFLVKLVHERGIRGALLAGDVFDSGMPSSESQELYYGFLLALRENGCRQIVVIAGNHDKPEFLEAPQGLLKRMDIHVIGHTEREHPEREIVALKDEAGQMAAVVCAVPYLAPGEVRGEVGMGEEARERDAAYAAGVKAHYRQALEAARALRNGNEAIPVIGMGHLYAAGSLVTSDEPRQPVGTLPGVAPEDIAEGYDYMALGHIHRPQRVGGRETCRYAGALLPMSLQERMYNPQVVLLDTEHPAAPETLEIPPECFRPMRVIHGTLPELMRQLEPLRRESGVAWVKPVLTGSEAQATWGIELRQFLRDSQVHIVDAEARLDTEDTADAPEHPVDGDAAPRPLSRMTPEELFRSHLNGPMKELVPDDGQRLRLLELYRSSEKKVMDSSSRCEEEPHSDNRGGAMRFKRLFFRNINSLYGENLIDFEAPDFKEGLFLIHGNTGAGKSSILDAICLALYQETPRGGKITKSHDNVMSEGTNDLSAELTFGLGEDEYRVCFSHARTRATSRDPFGAPEQRLFRNGYQLSIKNSDVLKEVERLLGMDMEQFTRCVLLAQGGFDAFLKAASKERARILMQLTGTGVYQEIGRQINADYLAVKNDYEVQQSVTAGIQLVPENLLAAMESEAEALRVSVEAVDRRLEVCGGIEELFGRIAGAETSFHDAEKELVKAEQVLREAAPLREQLTRAQRAQNCQGAFHEWQNVVRARDDLQTQIRELDKALPRLEEAQKAACNGRQEADKALHALHAKEQELRPLFQKVRQVENQMAGQRKLQRTADDEVTAARRRQQKAEKEFQKVQTLWNAQSEQAKASREYLLAHAGDEALERLRECWEVKRQTLKRQEDACEKETTDISNAEAACRKETAKLQRQRTLLTEAVEEQSRAQKRLDGLQAQQTETLGAMSRQELQTAWAAAGKLETFLQDGKLRAEYLKVGAPCPLCGSKEHPYCEGVQPPPDNSYGQLASDLRRRLDLLEETDTQLESARKAKAAADTRVGALHVAVEAMTRQLEETNTRLEERRRKCAEARREASEVSAELSTALSESLQVAWTEHSALPKELDARIAAYAGARADVARLEEARAAYGRAEAAHEAVRAVNESAVQQAQAKAAACDAEVARLAAERTELFGEKDVASEEAALEASLEEARRALALAEKRCTQAVSARGHNREEAATCGKKLSDAEAQVEQMFLALEQALGDNGFADTGDFLDARMEPNMLNARAQELRQLEAGKDEWLNRLDERRNALEELRRKLPAGCARDANQKERETLQACVETLRGQRETLVRKLDAERGSHRRHAEELEKLKQLRNTHNLWKLLNDAVGSTENTDRFGNLAEAYTFRELLYYANSRRLSSLMRHFTLVSDPEDPLMLSVKDHYRGGFVRTSANLSGGERFEVSLALALGLAEMSAVSKNARLGNVLLDEGFGTLDDTELENALELLSQLRGEEHKLVGIISHVEKLRERIHARIEVTSSGGMGSLSGAGVSSCEQLRAQWSSEHPAEAAKREAREARQRAARERDERREARRARKAST